MVLLVLISEQSHLTKITLNSKSNLIQIKLNYFDWILRAHLTRHDLL